MKILTMGNPGCGKTYNLVQKINEFIDRGYKPYDITILSHTRVAAKEIASRAKKSGVRSSTIHSLAYNIAEISRDMVVAMKEIKAFSEGIGVPMRGYSADTDDSLELGDEYMTVITYARSSMMSIEAAYNEKGRPGSYEGLVFFYENYKYWKSNYGFVDFDDMLEIAIKADVPHNYPVLLVDEAQDLSKAQWVLIGKISTYTREMVVTGDPDQSLFKWGGAWSQGMVTWAEVTGAQITELSQSYRVPSEPYQLSRNIISRVADRYEKDYKPTKEQGSVERFGSLERYDFKRLKSALILYRSHALRRSIERELIYNNKAYTTLNGTPGMCQNKYGEAVKAWIRIRNSQFPDKNDVNIVKRVATPALLKVLQSNDLEAIKSMRGERALVIPPEMIGYYRYVDFSKMADIQLSTIHGAKGMEHDTVIILNGMTQRVSDGMDEDPDSEYQVWYVAVTRTKDRLHIIDGEGVANIL